MNDKMKENTDKLCSTVYNTILDIIDSNSDRDKKIEVAEKLCNNLKSTFDNFNVNINYLLKISNEIEN